MEINKTDQVQSPILNPLQANKNQISNQNGNILIVIGIIILFLIIAGGAYYFGKSKALKFESQNPTVSQTSSVAPISSSTPDETASWKTYTNTLNNFEINYPTEASLKEIQEPPGTTSRIEISYVGPKQGKYDPNSTSVYGLKDAYFVKLWFLTNASVQPLYEATKAAYDYGKPFCTTETTPVWSPINSTSLAGKQAFSYKVTNCSRYDGMSYWVSNSKKIFTIQSSYTGDPSDKLKYEQRTNAIIATFKFTN